MVTVSHVVENIILNRPFLHEALIRGVINNAALAEELKPQVEKEMRKKVKFSAVNMAIRRLSEKHKKRVVNRTRFDRNTSITVQSDLVEIIVYKTLDMDKYVKELYDTIDFKNGGFLTITQGLHEFMIITNKTYEKHVTGLFEKNLKKIIRDLSTVSVNLPDEAMDTIGLFYIATKALAWENINLIDIVSTFTEMTFILREEDTARAYDCLKKMVKENT